MMAKWGEGGGREGEHEIFFFLKGGTENLVTFVGEEQKIFMNLNPIPGPPLVVKNDTSLRVLFTDGLWRQSVFYGSLSYGKFFTLQVQAISELSSCGEVTCYPEILRISYNLVRNNNDIYKQLVK